MLTGILTLLQHLACALSSGSTMRDLAVDYARDLRVVGICVSSVFTCCRFLRAGGFCLLPFFGTIQR